MALTKLGTGQGYLKAGFLGFAKSGKTFTATQLAIGLRQMMDLKGPIAMFDTENGSEYVGPMVLKATGMDLVGIKARAFTDLMQFGRDCVCEGVSVALVDSITHPWKEVCDAYLEQLNEKRLQSHRPKLQKLEFMHWSAIKGKGLWQDWTDFFLNSKLHLIICGRAGYEWDMEKDESGRNQLVKSGVKMRVESEFGFEPSLLIEMERQQVEGSDGGFTIKHLARVLGDRFNVLDGKEGNNPDFTFFKPHCELLKPGKMVPVDTAIKTETGADVEGNVPWDREKQQRTILCEEIQGLIVSKYPGQSADDKKAKAQVMQDFFGTRSWTKIESMDSLALRNGLDSMRLVFEPPVSNTGTEDDLPYNEPETPSKEKAPGDPSNEPVVEPAQSVTPYTVLRGSFVMNKIIESRFLGMLTELGNLPGRALTLEEAEEMAPGVCDSVLKNFQSFAKAYQDATKA